MGGSLAIMTLLGKLVDAVSGLADELVMEHSEFPLERVAPTLYLPWLHCHLSVPLTMCSYLGRHCFSYCFCLLVSLNLQYVLYIGQFENKTKKQFLSFLTLILGFFFSFSILRQGLTT